MAAKESETKSKISETNSKASENLAEQYKDSALESKESASQSEVNAIDAANRAAISEANAALSEASALESKNASAENAAKSQNNASNAKNSADSAKESETKAQEYSNLSQSNANASSESASNAKKSEVSAKSSEDASKKNADDSAATLQELKDGIASGDFKGEKGDKGDPGPAGADGKDAPQIDDTTVTDSAPWSSKHIVDMLCPPMEESGNPVVCYPVAGYALGVKASWEPTQEGSGDPSPDNVRPIKGRDSATVERCGENLWSLGNVGFKQYKEISINYPAGQYVLSYEVETESTDDTVQVGWLVDGKWKYSQEQKNQQIKISIIASVGISGLRFYAGSSPAYRGNATYKNIQLELGNAPTTYAPYTGQTATLNLPRTIYGGTVDAVTGEGNENAKIITLDGNELKFTKANIYINLPAHSAPGISKGGIICCSHFNRRLFSVDTTYEFCFLLESDITSLFASVDDLNAYLAAQYAAGTPVQIAYKLAEPMPFTAPGAQPIPALSGVNTVLTDADSATVTGKADPIKRITDLEDAVASMT